MAEPLATLLVSRRCDNACVFCASPAVDEDVPVASLRAALAALRSRTDDVLLVGGEPTAHTELDAVVAEARTLGFRAVGLQTNARALARPGVAVGLATAGLTHVHGSLHGADAAVHDYHTAVPGSFVAAMAGLGAARAAGLQVVVSTVLTRSNYRSLAPVPALLRSRGISAWHIAVPWPVGRAESNHDRVVPRLGLAVPFALHAVEAATRLGLPTYVSGVPLCLLGPYASRALPAGLHASRSHGTACEPCTLRDRCPGVHASYLARFAGDELSPRADAAPAADADLARWFTGPAEMAVLTERAIPEPPIASRRRLPVLDRPAPAVREQRGRAQKTGEALRAILPTLFEQEGEA